MQNLEETEIFTYKPEFYRCSDKDELSVFESLCERKSIKKTDTFLEQVNDLLPCLYPGDYFQKISIDTLKNRWLNGRNIATLGNWIYYPWRGEAVRVLEKNDFITCRTNRNLLKIKSAEQALLSEKKILFVGLSVGQSAAFAFAQQRIGGKLYLADFDTLSLSNMNRLRASVLDLGLRKTIIAARLIAELDPYIEVECIHEGATAENIANLMSQHGIGNVDLVVEECDSLDMKFFIRETAKKMRIPVIMETSDRGMLDIERFDFEAGRAVFHGKTGDITAKQVQDANPEEKFKILSQIVDTNQISDALKFSYAQLGKEILTWPQLAYEVNLGSSTLAYVAWQILTQKHIPSGRYYIDLEKIIQSGPCPSN